MNSTHESPAGIASIPALDKLERLVVGAGNLQSKLILLIGHGGKTTLLGALVRRLNAVRCNVGVELGQRLAATPVSDRSFAVNGLLHEIIGNAQSETPILLDHIEVLFDASLQINPLDCIRKLAHSRCVIATWPGELRDDRLVYANMGHPEHRSYGLDGIVVFETVQGQ